MQNREPSNRLLVIFPFSSSRKDVRSFHCNKSFIHNDLEWWSGHAHVWLRNIQITVGSSNWWNRRRGGSCHHVRASTGGHSTTLRVIILLTSDLQFKRKSVLIIVSPFQGLKELLEKDSGWVESLEKKYLLFLKFGYPTWEQTSASNLSKKVSKGGLGIARPIKACFCLTFA